MATVAAGTAVRTKLYRLGGVSGILAAILGVAANVLHPRPSPDKLGDEAALVDLVNGYALWRFDHLLIIAAVFLGVIALVALARSMEDGPGGHWAQIGYVSGIVSAAVATVSFSIDGLVLSRISELWSASSDQGAFAEVFAAVQSVDLAVLSVAMLTLFGITPLVYGLALVSSEGYARWIGFTAIIGAVAGVTAAVWIWMTGELGVGNFLIAFTLSTVAFTIWTFAASLRLLALGRG